MNTHQLAACLLALALLPAAALAQTYESTEDIPLNEPDPHVIEIPWAERLVETPELQVPDTLEDWETQREEIREMVIDTLGNNLYELGPRRYLESLG